MWVRSEYAGELAVLSTWLCALLPWSVTRFSDAGISAVTIRFLPVRFLYIFGTELPGERPVLFLWQVPGFVGTRGETLAAYAWIAGTLAFLVPLGISVAYYLREGAVESRIDPVRVLGALLVAVGLVFLVPVGLLWYYVGGLTLPVGVLFQLGLGAVLLRTERL
jgi:uncharacterized protein (TIGR04206 family)